jgi:hypothetical protein
MKDFDLFKFILIASIASAIIVGLSFIDYSNAISFSEAKDKLFQPLEWKNWHFVFLIFAIYINGK